jgi:peroxiredoxin
MEFTMKIVIFLLTFFVFNPNFSLAQENQLPAPDFKLKGVLSKSPVALSSFKNKIIVLEWLNHGCPFSKKHYESGNMQSLQKKYTGQGIIWLSIISSAPGKQGHVSLQQGLVEMKEKKSLATNVLIDEDGAVGKLYGAKTTPHMFVIDKKGKLAYQGAIDDQPDLDTTQMAKAKNYVVDALEQLLKNQKVSIQNTKAYGCSIKYAD